MSHIVTSTVEMKNEKALNRAIEKRGKTIQLQDLGNRVHELYGGQRAEGRGLKLHEWRHPIVVGKDGKVSYDNYGGSWGKQEELDKLYQIYSAECIHLAAEEHGGFEIHSETALADGTLVLEVEEAALCA